MDIGKYNNHNTPHRDRVKIWWKKAHIGMYRFLQFTIENMINESSQCCLKQQHSSS